MARKLKKLAANYANFAKWFKNPREFVKFAAKAFLDITLNGILL